MRSVSNAPAPLVHDVDADLPTSGIDEGGAYEKD